MNPDGVLGRKVGSVGRMVPGLTARIRDVETDAERRSLPVGHALAARREYF